MNTSIIIEATNIGFSIADKTLLSNVGVAIEEGSFTAIIGPNGAGKTTLLNILDGDNLPTSGEVLFENKPLVDFDRLSLARRRAVLPQVGSIPFAITVTDIISLGRMPYRYHHAQKSDDTMIADCLNTVDIGHLAQHHYSTLSGGEQHRVHIARTLAQISATTDSDLHGQVLFLDEPTNHLDVLHQYKLMNYLKKLQRRGLTVITVMHDLSLTLQFSEHIVLMNNGQKIGSYTPHSLVSSNDLSTAYQMDMLIRWDEQWQRFIIAPMVSV